MALCKAKGKQTRGLSGIEQGHQSRRLTEPRFDARAASRDGVEVADNPASLPV